MKRFNSIFLILTTLAGSLALSHGEDKPGPHNGSIKMPGAFHTEAVTEENNKLKIYLLDIDWKNPSVQDSSVKVIFHSQKVFEVECEKKENAFICVFDAAANLKSKGKLEVFATREKQKGNKVEYSTPLKVWKK